MYYIYIYIYICSGVIKTIQCLLIILIATMALSGHAGYG